MRLFYAAFLSKENMLAYQAVVDGLAEEIPGVLRPIPPLSHHLTLGFLGEIVEIDIDKCVTALDNVERLESFDYSLGRPSLLMGRGGPRLIRASVTDGGEQVQVVQTALISKVSEQLPSIDTRSKPPHVTLARFKKNARRSQARHVEGALERPFDTPRPGADRLSSVHLVKSSLTPSGPIYETVREVRLTNPTADSALEAKRRVPGVDR